MFSVKALLGYVVEHGRRAILLATRSQVLPSGPYKSLKLTEKQTQTVACRLKPKDPNLSQNVAGTVPNSNLSISSGGGIVNFLRPITSRIFQGLARRVSSPLWIEARRKSTKRLFGETAPYFALVGVTLVSGPERGLLTVQDELEAICGDIREAISRAGWIHNPDFWKAPPTSSSVQKEEFSLEDFELGSAISKGCSAVVYAAKWKQDAKLPSENGEEVPFQGNPSITEERQLKSSLESLKSLLPHGSLWFMNGKSQKDNFLSSTSSEDEYSHLSFESSSTDEFPCDQHVKNHYLPLRPEHSLSTPALNLPLSVSFTEINSQKLRTGSWQFDSQSQSATTSSTVSEWPQKRKKVRFKENETSNVSDHEELIGSFGSVADVGKKRFESSSAETYPMAVKMMFNYEAASNAPAILTAMYKEMVPARAVQLDASASLWIQRFVNSSVTLPPHTNIVDMPCVFVDRVPFLTDGLSLYPDALPKRINPTGFGRNMSLFCVMKRYDCTLAEYLTRQTPNIRTSLLLLTQLLEAVHHINKYGVVHRDLKSDNVLLCLREGIESPHLVLSDFGCCLLDSGLRVGFFSHEADPRVGNAALMAPEIKDAIPGMLTWLNYSKADLWAVGALAYEIFGMKNPFVTNWLDPSGSTTTTFDSGTYKEALLPKLPKTVPAEIRYLVEGLLKRNNKQRPCASVAATICQLSLWCPRKWLNRHALTMPSSNEVMRWLLCMSSKVLCEAGCSSGNEERSGRGSTRSGFEEKSGGQLEYEVVSTFLKRVHYDDIIQAIRWIRAF